MLHRASLIIDHILLSIDRDQTIQEYYPKITHVLFEVNIALQVSDLLSKHKVNAAVISMPCWELFENQSEEYKSEVLGNVLKGFPRPTVARYGVLLQFCKYPDLGFVD